MKHLITFKIYENVVPIMASGLTKKQEALLNFYCDGKWKVNPTTGLVDIEGDFKYQKLKAKSFLGIKFGNSTNNFLCNKNQLTSLEGSPKTVGGNFNCFYNRLTSLKGAPRTVGGDFSCFNNQLTSLAGAPETVDGDFDCDYNQLTSLEGSPQTVGGRFTCDEFQLGRGEWNMEGWLEVLNTGTEEAKKLILTLPWLQPEYWNNKLKEEPKATILQIVPIWDDLPSNIQDEIQIPSNWKDSFDNLLDLQRAGIF